MILTTHQPFYPINKVNYIIGPANFYVPHSQLQQLTGSDLECTYSINQIRQLPWRLKASVPLMKLQRVDKSVVVFLISDICTPSEMYFKNDL